MRLTTKALGGAFAAAAFAAAAACGGGETAPDIDDTIVTDVDPMEGSVDDTTVIDATLGSEESTGMADAMPADSAEPRAELTRDRPQSDRSDDADDEPVSNDVAANETE